MNRKKYTVTRGIEDPATGHWLDAGTDTELTERQAKILLLNGHIKPAAAAQAAPAKNKKR